jgi:hypothetical protein
MALIPPKNASNILKEVEKTREEEIKIRKIKNGEMIDRDWINEKLIKRM